MKPRQEPRWLYWVLSLVVAMVGLDWMWERDFFRALPLLGLSVAFGTLSRDGEAQTV